MSAQPAPERLPPTALPAADLLSVLVSEPRPGVLVVAPTGEVDIASAPLLHHAALRAVEAEPEQVVVDLSGLTFCGSTGLVVLVDAQDRAHATGVCFCTAGAGRTVRRVLELTGLAPLLDHRDSVALALGPPPSGTA